MVCVSCYFKLVLLMLSTFFSFLFSLFKDSFEDDKSKVLMILCASPDPKEIHKTISTLEYGAKAKCIVRGPHSPVKEEDSSSTVILGSRIAAMDEFIMKLQMENKLKEKERNEAHKKLMKKEEEIAELRAKVETAPAASEEEINLKVNERTRLLRQELEKKLEECQRMTNDFVELERKRMEERILQQQEEVETLRKRLEEIELQLSSSKQERKDENGSKEIEPSGFMRKLLSVYKSEDDLAMVKSMDLDMDDQEPFLAREVIVGMQGISPIQPSSNTSNVVQEYAPNFGQKACLSTVYEEEGEGEGEGEQDHEDKVEEDEEVEKEVIEEKRVCSVRKSPKKEEDYSVADKENNGSNRMLRIHNIFTLCGNQRELSQYGTPLPAKKRCDENCEIKYSPLKSSEKKDSVLRISNKENLVGENLEQHVVAN